MDGLTDGLVTIEALRAAARAQAWSEASEALWQVLLFVVAAVGSFVIASRLFNRSDADAPIAGALRGVAGICVGLALVLVIDVVTDGKLWAAAWVPDLLLSQRPRAWLGAMTQEVRTPIYIAAAFLATMAAAAAGWVWLVARKSGTPFQTLGGVAATLAVCALFQATFPEYVNTSGTYVWIGVGGSERSLADGCPEALARARDFRSGYHVGDFDAAETDALRRAAKCELRAAMLAAGQRNGYVPTPITDVALIVGAGPNRSGLNPLPLPSVSVASAGAAGEQAPVDWRRFVMADRERGSEDAR